MQGERGREKERGNPRGERGLEEGWAAMGCPSFTWLEDWLSSRTLKSPGHLKHT